MVFMTMLSILAISQQFYDEDVPGAEYREDYESCPTCTCDCPPPTIRPELEEEDEIMEGE